MEENNLEPIEIQPIQENKQLEQNQKTFPCLKCGKVLNSVLSHSKHFQKCMLRENYLQKTKLKKSKKRTLKKKFPSKQCPKCGKIFKNEYYVQAHYEKCKNTENYLKKSIVKTHQRLKKKKLKKLLNKKDITDSEILEKMKGSETKQFDCDLIFEQMQKIQTNSAIKQNHACIKCDKLFDSKETLELHFNKCEIEKHFACIKCDEKFVDQQTVTEHFLQAHEEKNVVKPFYCIKCKKQFVCSRGNLERHLQICQVVQDHV